MKILHIVEYKSDSLFVSVFFSFPDVGTLEASNQQLRDETRCKVCLDEDACIVFLKCGHLVCCSECAPELTKCPVCRQNILGTIRVDKNLPN